MRERYAQTVLTFRIISVADLCWRVNHIKRLISLCLQVLPLYFHFLGKEAAAWQPQHLPPPSPFGVHMLVSIKHLKCYSKTKPSNYSHLLLNSVIYGIIKINRASPTLTVFHICALREYLHLCNKTNKHTCIKHGLLRIISYQHVSIAFVIIIIIIIRVALQGY